MHKLDSEIFYRALKKKGYRSVKELAQTLGIHRNTIHYYLSGNGVFPTNLEKIFKALDLAPQECIQSEGEDASPVPVQIAALIDSLHAEFPHVTFVLFGSRARGRAQNYSDWDIGVFSRQGLEHALYRRMERRKDDLAEDLPYFVELINLDRADDDFLKEASRGWLFLTGSQQDWMTLCRRACP